MRNDLLSLTPDDLAILSNRGTLKRVQRELQDGAVSAQMSESEDGTVIARWAEQITCTLPSGVPLSECTCTCPTLGICRHLVQTVLYYQQWVASESHESEGKASTAPNDSHAPWNPSEISDEALSRHFSKAEFARIRREFEQPHVIELLRGPKPLARFHSLPVVVRFLVPGDLQYTVCNCAEAKPCSHVALAVWGFRLLPADRVSGIIETGRANLSVPADVLEDIHAALCDLLELGISGASDVSTRRLGALARRCQDEGLIWPANILAEIHEECQRYRKQDSQFSAQHVTELIGELVLRCRAIHNSSEAIPSVFVRGSQRDCATEIDTARLTGLGCQAVTRYGRTQLSAYLVDTDSGSVVAIQREFADPKAGDGKTPLSYPELGRATVFKDSTLATVGTRQVLVKGGKRSTNATFIPGRAAASVMPSTFNWENLRPPLLADSFAENRAHRAAQPPRCLSPRRLGEDLVVYAICSVEEVAFDPLRQALLARIRDYSQDTAILIHPFTLRGSEGMDSLVWWLNHHADGLRFVSGSARFNGSQLGGQLEISPIALIFEADGQRRMIQPWVDRRSEGMQAITQKFAERAASIDSHANYLQQLMLLSSELILNGVRRSNAAVEQQWQFAAQQGSALGFVRFVEPVETLATLLSSRQHQLDWNWQGSAEVVLALATLIRFAQDVI